MKRILLLLPALMCVLCLSGCMPLSVQLQRADQEVVLPAPAAEALDPAVGDSSVYSTHRMTLYYISSDQQMLVPFQRSITANDEETLILQTINALKNAPANVDAVSPIPVNTRVLGLERSGGLTVVNLSIDARNVANDQQLLWLQTAISETLTGFENIESVNVLISSRDEGVLGMPSGAHGPAEGNLPSLWARLLADETLYSRKDTATPIERSAVLYYATRDGEYIAPVVRTVQIMRNDPITPLIEALCLPPQEADCLLSPFPTDAPVLAVPPEIVEGEDGRRMVRLVFDANLIATLEREGLNAWQLYASLTYTITGFVPDIDGLIILIGDGQLTRVERDGEELAFIGGEMNRMSYPEAVGHLTPVYMSSEEGSLVRLYRPLHQSDAVSPRARLNELFKGPAAWEMGAARVLPDGASIDDILGVRIEDSEAVVNLSSNLYRCCQSLTPQQERNLIYAIVNTLTEMHGVDAVRFQLEGESIESLVGEIYLRGALMRNPGIIR